MYIYKKNFDKWLDRNEILVILMNPQVLQDLVNKLK
jgi:hypothetical protein